MYVTEILPTSSYTGFIFFTRSHSVSLGKLLDGIITFLLSSFNIITKSTFIDIESA